jgi:hypothetical protein
MYLFICLLSLIFFQHVYIRSVNQRDQTLRNVLADLEEDIQTLQGNLLYINCVVKIKDKETTHPRFRHF